MAKEESLGYCSIGGCQDAKKSDCSIGKAKVPDANTLDERRRGIFSHQVELQA